MTLSLDYVLTHWGENWCWSLFRLNGVEILGGNVMPSLSWCQSADNLWVKTNRITYLVETTEPLFSFSYVFLLIICFFSILESVWRNLPCRQYYAVVKHLFLLELFISLSLFFFAQCELQYARLLVSVSVDHFFWTQVLGLCPEVVCVWFLLQTRQAYHTRCTFKAKAGLVAQCLCYGNRFITNSK